jgi:hypothetical protein
MGNSATKGYQNMQDVALDTATAAGLGRQWRPSSERTEVHAKEAASRRYHFP